MKTVLYSGNGNVLRGREDLIGTVLVEIDTASSWVRPRIYLEKDEDTAVLFWIKDVCLGELLPQTIVFLAFHGSVEVEFPESVDVRELLGKIQGTLKK